MPHLVSPYSTTRTRRTEARRPPRKLGDEQRYVICLEIDEVVNTPSSGTSNSVKRNRRLGRLRDQHVSMFPDILENDWTEGVWLDKAIIHWSYKHLSDGYEILPGKMAWETRYPVWTYGTVAFKLDRLFTDQSYVDRICKARLPPGTMESTRSHSDSPPPHSDLTGVSPSRQSPSDSSVSASRSDTKDTAMTGQLVLSCDQHTAGSYAFKDATTSGAEAISGNAEKRVDTSMTRGNSQGESCNGHYSSFGSMMDLHEDLSLFLLNTSVSLTAATDVERSLIKSISEWLHTDQSPYAIQAEEFGVLFKRIYHEMASQFSQLLEAARKRNEADGTPSECLLQSLSEQFPEVLSTVFGNSHVEAVRQSIRGGRLCMEQQALAVFIAFIVKDIAHGVPMAVRMRKEYRRWRVTTCLGNGGSLHEAKLHWASMLDEESKVFTRPDFHAKHIAPWTNEITTDLTDRMLLVLSVVNVSEDSRAWQRFCQQATLFIEELALMMYRTLFDDLWNDIRLPQWGEPFDSHRMRTGDLPVDAQRISNGHPSISRRVSIALSPMTLTAKYVHHTNADDDGVSSKPAPDSDLWRTTEKEKAFVKLL